MAYAPHKIQEQSVIRDDIQRIIRSHLAFDAEGNVIARSDKAAITQLPTGDYTIRIGQSLQFTLSPAALRYILPAPGPPKIIINPPHRKPVIPRDHPIRTRQIAEMTAEVRDLVASGKEDAAIERLRAYAGWEQAEAEVYVQAIRRHEVPRLPVCRTSLSVTEQEELFAIVNELLGEGETPQAAMAFVTDLTTWGSASFDYVRACQYYRSGALEPLDGPVLLMSKAYIRGGLQNAMEHHLEELLFYGWFVEAVRFVRDVTGWSFKKARDYTWGADWSQKHSGSITGI